MRTNPRKIIESDISPQERMGEVIAFPRPASADAITYYPARRSNEMIDFFRAQVACSESVVDE